MDQSAFPRMLTVLRVHLPSDIPIVGCELTPYVLLRLPDKSVTTDDVPESSPINGHFLRYKWSVSSFFLLLVWIFLMNDYNCCYFTFEDAVTLALLLYVLLFVIGIVSLLLCPLRVFWSNL